MPRFSLERSSYDGLSSFKPPPYPVRLSTDYDARGGLAFGGRGGDNFCSEIRGGCEGYHLSTYLGKVFLLQLGRNSFCSRWIYFLVEKYDP